MERTMTILEEIMTRKEKEIASLKKELKEHKMHPLHSFLNKKKRASFAFENSLKKEGLAIISEIKRRSPSAGEIGEIQKPQRLALLYTEGGASAISVLTDQESFGGNIEDLIAVKKISHLPVLRKDFILDEVQIAQSVALGADALLIIVAALGEKSIDLVKASYERGIEPLVEIHTEKELEIALRSEAHILEVNSRNLKTFKVDLNIALRLKEKIPSHLVTVAASGIKGVEDARKMRLGGYDALLVGQALVESKNPKELIEEMKKA